MILLAAALFVISLGYGVVVPQMPAFFPADVGAATLYAVYLGYAMLKYALQVPGGLLADRVGDARVIRVGLVVFTASLLALALPLPPWGVVAARSLEGAATGALYPALLLRASRAAGENRGAKLGTISGIGTSGFIVGPGLAALLAEDFGPRAPVWIAFALGVVVTVAALILVRDEAAVVARTARSLGDELRSLRAPLASVAFIALMVPVLQNKLVYTGLQAVLPLSLPSLKVDERGVALVFVATGVGFAFGQPLGGALGDRVRPRSALYIVMPLCALALGALAFIDAERGGARAFLAIYLAWVVLASTGWALALKALADEHGGKDGAGALFGVYQTLTDVTTIVGPPLYLAVFTATVSTATSTATPSPVFFAMAAAPVVGLLAYAALQRAR